MIFRQVFTSVSYKINLLLMDYQVFMGILNYTTYFSNILASKTVKLIFTRNLLNFI